MHRRLAIEGDDFIAALDKKTGRELWRTKRDEVTTWTTPLIVTHEGTTVVLKNGGKPEILATNTLPEGIDASPAIVGRELFLRGKSTLYCIAAN